MHLSPLGFIKWIWKATQGSVGGNGCSKIFFCDLFLGFHYLQDNPTLTLVEFNTKLKNASAKVFSSLKLSLLSRKQVDETRTQGQTQDIWTYQ